MTRKNDIFQIHSLLPPCTGHLVTMSSATVCKKNVLTFNESFFEIDVMKSGMERYYDYGGLEIQKMGRKRQISDSDYLSASNFRPPGKSRDDDGNDAYLAFDDDYLRGTEGTLNKNPLGKVCRRTRNHRLNFQNCNTIFETDLLQNHAKYLKYVSGYQHVDRYDDNFA